MSTLTILSNLTDANASGERARRDTRQTREVARYGRQGVGHARCKTSSATAP